jgi:uncharacterized protein involved in exopolysaccharide biosynthesis
MAGERVSDSSGPKLSGDLDAELGQSVPTQKPLAYVVMFTGEVPDRIFSIRSATTLLGRSNDATLSFTDPSVSLHHARIVQKEHGFEIVDLDSTNGTFLGGKRTSRSPLRNADHVSLGNVDFIFLLDRPSTATIRLPDRIARPSLKGMSPIVPTIVPAPPAQPRRKDDDDEEGPSLADILRKVVNAYAFVRDRAFFIGALALVGAGLGILSLFVYPPGVSATDEVRLLPHMTLSANPNEDPWQNTERESPAFVKSAERALTQPDLIRATFRKLRGFDLPDPAIMAIAFKMKIEEIGDHMFRVTYKDKINAQPQPIDFLPLHVRNYVQADIARSLGELTAKVDFLRNQLKAVEGDVDRVSGERATYREANVDRLPEDAQQTHSSRFDLETRRTELSSQLHQQEAELKAAEDQLNTNRPEAQRKFQWSESYRQSLLDVNRKLSAAYARGLGDGHPEVQALKEEKERLEALSKAELQSSTSTLARESDPNYQAARGSVEKLRAQVAATRASLGETERSLGNVRRVVRDLPRVEQHLSDLDHRQEAANQLHADLFSKLKQAEIQLNLEKVSAESRYEVSPPHLERSRNRSTLATRGGLGIFFGVLAAALAIALREAKRLISNTMAAGAVLVPPATPRRTRPVSKRS